MEEVCERKDVVLLIETYHSKVSTLEARQLELLALAMLDLKEIHSTFAEHWPDSFDLEGLNESEKTLILTLDVMHLKTHKQRTPDEPKINSADIMKRLESFEAMCLTLAAESNAQKQVIQELSQEKATTEGRFKFMASKIMRLEATNKELESKVQENER
jgi:hypothetical protein